MSKHKEAAKDAISSSQATHMTEVDTNKNKSICPLCQSELRIDGLELWCLNCGFITDLMNISLQNSISRMRR